MVEGWIQRWRNWRITMKLRRRYGLPRGDYHFGRGFDFRHSVSSRLELHAPLYVDDYVCIKCKGRLVIGERSFINRNAMIACRDEIVIGTGVIIANNVSIYDHDHLCTDPNRPYAEQGYRTGAVRIGNNAWLGVGAVILRGVSIGEGAVIGAGAVVVKDVPAAEIWAGVPARYIRPVFVG